MHTCVPLPSATYIGASPSGLGRLDAKDGSDILDTSQVVDG